MPKKKSGEAATLERFERALRNALGTPPEKARAPKKRAKKKRKSR